MGDVGQDVEWRCVAHGIPRPVVRWMKDGEPVVASDYIHLVDGSILRILGLVPSDAGTYQCTASNQLGQADRTVRLVVANPPSSPPSGQLHSSSHPILNVPLPHFLTPPLTME